MQMEPQISAAQADAVADFTVGLILSLDRSVVERELQKNNKKWRRDVSISPPYHALSLMKVGIAGFGAVGRKVAERLLPFGCDILVYSPGADAQEVRDCGCVPAALDDLFRECDAVTLHLCRPEEAGCLVTAKQLGMMKATSWLVNVTQAGLIDEAALIDAVTSGKIAGAALDVFSQEPLPETHPLIGLPNVILTPHIAGISAGGR